MESILNTADLELVEQYINDVKEHTNDCMLWEYKQSIYKIRAMLFREERPKYTGLSLCDVIEQICATHDVQIHKYWHIFYDAIVLQLPNEFTNSVNSSYEYEILKNEYITIALQYDDVQNIVKSIKEYDFTKMHPYGRTGYGLVETAQILAMRNDEPVRAVCEILDALLYQYKLYKAAGGRDVDFDFEQTCELLKSRYTVASNTALTTEPQPYRIKIDETEQRKLKQLWDKSQTACKSGKQVKLFNTDYKYSDFISSIRNCDFSKAFAGGDNTNGRALLRLIYYKGKEYTGIHPDEKAYQWAAHSIGTTMQDCNKSTSHSPVWENCK